MSTSIVPQLVGKDLRLLSRIILTFVVVSLIFIAILAAIWDHVPAVVQGNFGFILLIGPAGTCGIVMLMKTNVLEKEKSTQAFIMSLPVTVKEFTRAKLWVNLPVFGLFWAAISAVAFYFAFARGLFPLGGVPFVTMVFLGGFVAYTCILAVSLVSQNLGMTVLCIALFEMATSGYLWAIAFLNPISQHIWGAVAVWNPTAVGIVAAQLLVAVSVIVVTLLVQNTKRDFI
ncbi:putative membrane protein [Asticcacaulis biprosthecium C19]|uniref:Putative membrane protein n=1 Tax=Asticcacaulis biprosthecium C19 TaxID=715226 RepID=F4QKL9_9CAUL|nr:hypothetical protein [Asticcacaulis biprosthecium]EGF93321.1 putative membrane protein [Asticcacaulis biprosthecium C19]